ncbi:MAG: hypothetical protein CM1200mP39_16540 [Dehalococcoidia bacterium]|nr:MAG: hypothetical protein CM1200mP39_16540 [Dehalococcoidia bacterium]
MMLCIWGRNLSVQLYTQRPVISKDELFAAEKRPSSFYRPQFEETGFDPFSEEVQTP